VEIGIDVGGTHTRVVVAGSGPGETTVHVPTATWLRGTLFSDEANAARLLALVPTGAVGRADVPLVAGVNGCDTTRQCELFTSWLRRHHPGPLLVLSDAELLGPALGLNGAIDVVCGTGSIVVGRDRDGRLVKVGGHGWLLGDPGAAPSLVRESVVAILHAHDQGRPPGVLARTLMDHYGAPDPVQLGYDFTQDASPTAWGALAPLVFDAADAGDEVALAVIARDAAQVAADVLALHGLGVPLADVVLGGGVVTAQPRLERAITDALAARAPDARVHLVRTAPVRGALALARSRHATRSDPSEISHC